MIAYIEDIDFVPNRRLGAAGKLVGQLADAEKRGEALFYKPFPHDPGLSCAACHVPTGAFVDHRQHDVGSGGLYKTPTLLNANFNAPYFHDGRYTNYAQVVNHFDRVFYLGLSVSERQDLVAYLQAVGDGEQAQVPDNIEAHLTEISDFMSVLDTALPEHNTRVTTLTVDTVDREVRDLTERYPDQRNSTVAGGARERAFARGALKDLVLSLHDIDSAARGGHFDEAAADLVRSRELLAAARPLLHAAEPWSLFNRQIHDAHFAAVRRLYRNAVDPALAPRQRLDAD
jgi:hypothetical protein